MTCDEARSAILSGETSDELTIHVSGCSECQPVRPALDRLAANLNDHLIWEEPSPQLFDRVLLTLESAVSSPPARRRRFNFGWVAAALLVVLVALVPLLAMDRPDWETTLKATAAAPGATATIAGWNTEAGTRMKISITGLSPAPADTYYEVWMTAPDGRHISAGSFRGPGEVTVWSGGTRAQYPRIWITQEPDDADNNPSGPTLLDSNGV